jgi:two-component system sporulation sensor kinase A
LKINIYKEDENLVIEFKDNAGGIKLEVIDKIFDPFVSTKEHSGMGIGLNIAKKIIKTRRKNNCI